MPEKEIKRIWDNLFLSFRSLSNFLQKTTSGFKFDFVEKSTDEIFTLLKHGVLDSENEYLFGDISTKANLIEALLSVENLIEFNSIWTSQEVFSFSFFVVIQEFLFN